MADINTFINKISKISLIQRILIFTGTIILLSGAFIWFLYIPKTSEIKELNSKIETLDREIRLAEHRARNLAKLEKEHAKVQKELRFALRLLPTKSEIPKLLKNITKLGNESNLEFLLFKPEKQVSKDFYVDIPVTMEVRGKYHDVAIFFDKIGKLERIVNVTDASMIPIEAYSTDLKTSCKAVTYKFKEEKKEEDASKKKK